MFIIPPLLSALFFEVGTVIISIFLIREACKFSKASVFDIDVTRPLIKTVAVDPLIVGTPFITETEGVLLRISFIVPPCAEISSSIL